MIIELLLIHLFLALLTGFYYLALKNKGLPEVNRGYLLLAPVIACLLPFMDVMDIREISTTIDEIQLPSVLLHPETAVPENSSGSWLWLLTGIYGVGMLFRLLKLMTGVVRLLRLKKQGTLEVHEGKELLRIPTGNSAFSFAGKIFIGQEVEVDPVLLEHEKAHIDRRHTLDLFFLEFLHVLFWYDPSLPWIKKALKTEHELEADGAVLGAGYEKKAYSRYLLKSATEGSPNAYVPEGPVHSFNQVSQIKNRIHMMYEKPNPFMTMARMALLIPVILGMIFIVSCKAERSAKPPSTEGNTEIVKEPDQQPTFRGSQKALFEYLGEHIQYPESAKQDEVEGKVMMRFVVGAQGEVRDLEVLNEADSRLEQEALRVIEEMPAWNPGKKDGKAVPVKMVLPVQFKL